MCLDFQYDVPPQEANIVSTITRDGYPCMRIDGQSKSIKLNLELSLPDPAISLAETKR